MSTKGSLVALTILVPLLVLAGCQGQSSQSSTAAAGTGTATAQNGTARAGGTGGGRGAPLCDHSRASHHGRFRPSRNG